MRNIFFFYLVSLLFFFLFADNLFSQEKEIIRYLDSGDYEMEHFKRVDKMLHYIIQAEQLVYKVEELDPLIKQRVELNFTSIFQYIKQTDLAIEHLKRWMVLAEITNKKGVMFIVNSSRLGANYLELNKPDSSKKYFELSLYYSEIENNDLYISSAHNNLGVFYFDQNKIEKAKIYYEEALSRLDTTVKSENALAISIWDNLADYYLIKKDTSRAIQIIEENIKRDFKSKRKHPNFLTYNLKLYDLLISNNRLNDARYKLNYLYSLIKKDNPEKVSFDFKKKILTRLITSSKKDNLLELVSLLNEVNDSIINEQGMYQTKLNESINGYLVRVSEREKQSLIKESKKNNQIYKNKQIAFLLLLSFLILVIVLSTKIYSSRIKISSAEKKIKEQELKVQHLENKKLSKDLDLKRNDFSDLHMQITLQESFSDEIVEKLKELKSRNNEDLLIGIKDLIRYLNQKSSVFEKLDIQKKGMDDVNSAFFEKLDHKFPLLTKSERELCGMIRLRLDGKEIAMIRNIQPSSVRKLRYRLRKKLDIKYTEDIYEFMTKV